MPYEFIKFAFTAGILAPNFHGRSDLKFYDAGLRDAKNFFVDTNGGIASRPGTRFLDNLGNGPLRAWRFRSNTSVESDFLLIFGTSNLRIYSEGEWRETISYGGTLTTGILNEHQLRTLNFSQFQNTLIVTHEDFQPVALTRIDKTWSLRVEDTEGGALGNINSNNLLRVTAEYTSSLAGGVFGFPAPDPKGVVYGIALVGADGVETPIVNYHLIEDLPEGAAVFLRWNDIEDVDVYRIYRSGIIQDGGRSSLAIPLGYLAEVHEPAFTDTGLDPIYETQPIQYANPFQPGAITKVTISKNGSGYGTNNAAAQTPASSGAGFVSFPVVDPNGVVVGQRLVRGGREYNSGDIVEYPGVPSSQRAKGTITANPRRGIFPRTSVRFQQRRVYAGSTRRPMTIWASQVGAYSTFGTKRIPSDSDAFEIDLEAEEVNPIRHLIPTSSGMLAFTAEEVFRIHGVDGFGPTTAASDPLQYEGASELQPLFIHGAVLYVEDSGRRVRALSPGQQLGTYQNNDRSLLSNNLFRTDNQIVQWAYARRPHDIVWAVREDGTMLSFTYSEEQGVYAWTVCDANTGHRIGLQDGSMQPGLLPVDDKPGGKFKDVVVLQEQNNPNDIVYLLVERGGNYYLEKFEDLEVDRIDDVWGLDSAIQVRPENKDEVSLITGLSHLNGRTVAALVDGRPLFLEEVKNGQIELKLIQEGARDTIIHGRRVITVGLPFTGMISTLPIRSLELPTGRLTVSEAKILSQKAVTTRTLRTNRHALKYSTDNGVSVFEFPTVPEEVREDHEKFLSAVNAEFIDPQPLEPDASIQLYKIGPGQVFVLGFDVDVEVDPNAISVTGELQREG